MIGVRIEFSNKYIETTIPIIRLTKSRNKMTGTATFVFVRPFIFQYVTPVMTKMPFFYKSDPLVSSSFYFKKKEEQIKLKGEELELNSWNFLDKMYLIWENKTIRTNDIQIIFENGKPFLIKSIFLFKNSKDWFQFLNFMNYYSKERGLSFTEIQNQLIKKNKK
jgi:photosystem II protein